MILKENSTKQKLRGAYYTPVQLADAIVNFFEFRDLNNILEPSCGDGVFLDSLNRLDKIDNIKNVTAVEIDKCEAEKVDNNFKKNSNVSVLCSDFFDYFKDNDQKFDLILGNPPYIRYQYLTEHQRELQSKILIDQGMKSNKLINAWVAFLVACTKMLSKNGKIAFIVPAEILQVAYAEELRIFLSKEFSKITLITFEKLVFPVEQEVVIFIGEKSNSSQGIRIIELKDLKDFNSLDLDSNIFQKMDDSKEKWTKYFIDKDQIDAVKSIRNDERFVEFSEFGIINVGITTGNNKFFSIDEYIEKKYGLGDVTLPLIGRSSHSKGIFFTKEDYENNVKNGKNTKLIKFPNKPYDEYSSGHKKYIQEGENKGENKGYKCSIRERWYIVPSIWEPDAFFLRRSSSYPKLTINRCNAVSTDTMHRIKFNSDVDHELTILSYYNSVSFAFAELCGRSYGGGVLEILPSEMGNIMIPKIEQIDVELKSKLLNEVDIFLRNDDIDKVLNLIDKEILVNILGIKPEICKKFRCIWRKMQQRRLKRIK